MKASEMHSGLQQQEREKTIRDFKSKKILILVATDILSRGIDIKGIETVINYEVPNDAEDYVHRIGRTGRAGKTGHAISFACEKYALNLPAIEEYIRHPIEVTDYHHDALLDDVKKPKVDNRRYQRNQRGRPRRNTGSKPRT